MLVFFFFSKLFAVPELTAITFETFLALKILCNHFVQYLYYQLNNGMTENPSQQLTWTSKSVTICLFELYCFLNYSYTVHQPEQKLFQYFNNQPFHTSTNEPNFSLTWKNLVKNYPRAELGSPRANKVLFGRFSLVLNFPGSATTM